MKRRFGKFISAVALGSNWKGMSRQSRRQHRRQRRIDRRALRRDGQRDAAQEVRWAGDENGWSE